MNKPPSPAPAIERDAAAALMQPLTDLVIRAGAAILAVNRGAMRIEGKLDGSPVTEADFAADRIIADGLARLIPEVPVLSEERVDLAKPPYHGSFFLVDPHDGTKEFVAGRSEFTVNIALVTNGTPLLGIVGAPALGLIWRGLVGKGAERLKTNEIAAPIHTRPHPGPLRDKGLGAAVEMRAADRHGPGRAGPGMRASMDRRGDFICLQALGAFPNQAAPDQSERRRADNAQKRRPVRHQRDVDRELAAASDEFLGAVERIDQKEAAMIRRLRQIDAL